MNKRIFELRKKLSLTQKEFANKIGLSHGSLSDIENGKTSITERTILTICTIYNVNENWLRTGEGEMFNAIDKKYDEFFSTYKNLNPILQDYLLKCAQNLLDAQSKL